MKTRGDFPHIRYLFAKRDYFKYRRLMKTLESSLAFESSDVAKFRLHVLKYYYKWGLRPSLDAFRVKKSTLYDWKNLFESSHKRLVSLIPQSTRPHKVRVITTDWRLVDFIKQMRKDYGNVGANIIKPFLNEYARKKDLKTISRATIERIIKRRKFTFEKRVYVLRKFKFKKLRTRKSPKVKEPGFIQMDSIVVYINKEKHLFMSIMDIYTKFALVEYVTSLKAKTAKQVFQKFLKLSPTPITTVQTDNGSEFLGVFHDYLEQKKIKHQFIYPRMVKVNSIIERFNRTIQEECILRNDEIYYDIPSFKEKLTKYLMWYNYQRPHASLNYVSPMQFINTRIPKS